MGRGGSTTGRGKVSPPPPRAPAAELGPSGCPPPPPQKRENGPGTGWGQRRPRCWAPYPAAAASPRWSQAGPLRAAAAPGSERSCRRSRSQSPLTPSPSAARPGPPVGFKMAPTCLRLLQWNRRGKRAGPERGSSAPCRPARPPPRRGHRPEPPVTGPAAPAPRAPAPPNELCSPRHRGRELPSAAAGRWRAGGGGMLKSHDPSPRLLAPRARSSPRFPAGEACD